MDQHDDDVEGHGHIHGVTSDATTGTRGVTSGRRLASNRGISHGRSDEQDVEAHSQQAVVEQDDGEGHRR